MPAQPAKRVRQKNKGFDVMLIFTNCLSETPDEGCLKIANGLIKRIKSFSPETKIVSYERQTSLTDLFVSSNKLLLTGDIIRTVGKCNESILYVPFPARSSATALRILILSLFAKKKVSALLTQVTEISFLAKVFLSLCKAEILVVSDDTKHMLDKAVTPKRIRKIPMGVDTKKFIPVAKEKSAELKAKYGIPPEKTVILHVGHLNEGRNVAQLMKLDEKYQVILVTSTLTKDEQDKELKNRLLSCPNIRLIDDYVPNIEELYQLADVYFFPVIELGKCIDVPVSCLEAAACNKPVVTTDFGEMKAFKDKSGFWLIDSFEEENLNRLVDEAVSCANPDSRTAVLDYDWSKAVNGIINS